MFSFITLFGIALVAVFIIIQIMQFVVAKKTKVNNIQTNVVDIIGKNGVVIDDLSDIKTGTVSINGKVWRAIADDIIIKGEKIEVSKILGNKLVVTRAENLDYI